MANKAARREQMEELDIYPPETAPRYRVSLARVFEDGQLSFSAASLVIWVERQAKKNRQLGL
jgi:hypothetical protein